MKRSRAAGETIAAARHAAAGRRPAAAPRRLPLASLRVFVAVAEHGGLTRAAQALGVTTGAVTMQVQALEDYLGLPVFHRRGRSVELTAEGTRLLPDVQAGLRQIESALDAARRERGRKPLKVTMLASFLQQWLLPRLPDLRVRHPQIDLRVHTTAECIAFEGTDIQAAIRLGGGRWPALHCERLFDEWLLPVCAPSLLERLGPALSAQDLARYPLLHASTEPWSAWCRDGAAPTAEEWAESGNTFDDSVAVIRAAEGGLGLALARWSLAEGALRAGTLVLASSRIVRSGRSYWFVCPPGYLRLRKVKDLRDWLVAQCAAMPLPPGVKLTAAAGAAPPARR